MTKFEDSGISLYFELGDGKTADLAVIASAALAWDSLIKEIASVVDPSLNLRIELVSGERGSLWLKSLLRATHAAAKKNPVISVPLGAIVSAFLLAPVSHIGEIAGHKAFDLVGIQWDDGISAEDVKTMSEAVASNLRNKNALDCKSEIFRHIERDPAIVGLGAGVSLTDKPKTIVPRSEFHARSEPPTKPTPPGKYRELPEDNCNVVLIKPVLISKPSAWRFQRGSSQFSATMEDKKFLEAIGSRHTGLELGQGIEMTVNLLTRQEFIDGVWVNKKISVTRVVSSAPRPSPESELFPD